jgi:hypothetical protein
MFNEADLFLTNLGARKLKKELLGTATDKFIELLLMSMDLSFYLIKDDDYQNHLKDSEGRDFKGRYFFRSADEKETIAASAIFENANMRVGFEAIDDWDVMVTFKNGKALRNFIFSEKQDIFESISENAVEVDGNLNHIFKFGFMVQDLTRRLGIE